jgi:aspartyl-tRNA(Asn)/glutamyl-tRNA(Gln) amidotransferase subunit A
MTELHHLTIAEASRRIARGRLSPVDLVDASLARIEAQNPRLNAFVLVCPDAARKAARRAHTQIRAGRRMGPLHGIPLGLKDLYATKGVRTTGGSGLLLNNVPNGDAVAAAHLFKAGMVLVGKLATHEFALGGPATDLPFPPAVNPWGEGRFTGGSSSGSGAAVAAGMVPAALGSDTGGSIRIPAAHCGIAGFKPTYDLVSREGVIPLSPSMDHCGPMTWTTEDAALLMDALAGDGRPRFSRALRGGIKGMRIGIVRRFHGRDLPCLPEIAAAFDRTLTVLRSLGARLVELDLPPLAEWNDCGRLIWQAEAYAIYEADLRRRPRAFSRSTSTRLLAGAALSAADYIQALRQRTRLNGIFAAAMAKVDVIVTGSVLATSPLLTDMIAGGANAFPPSVMMPFNVTGAPALSVCAGFSAAGLPLSIQLAGKPGDDTLVLRAGHAYEQAAGWRDRRPGS